MNLLNMLRHDRHSSNQARKARLRRQPALDSLEERKVLSTFTVTSVADSGLGTLRQAIVGADAASDAATINFAITSASKTISLRSALPELSNTHGMTINGQSGVEVDLTHASLADGNSIHVDQLASVTVNNLEFDNAPARAFENNGTLVLSDVTVSGSHNGAAVNYGTMTISNSTIKERDANNFPISHELWNSAIVPFGKNVVEDDLHILLEGRRILPAGLVDLAEKPYFHLQSRGRFRLGHVVLNGLQRVENHAAARQVKWGNNHVVQIRIVLRAVRWVMHATRDHQSNRRSF